MILLPFLGLGVCYQAIAALNAKANGAMVVSAQHLATQAGVEILKQGGNAIDAAVAVGYALSVVNQSSGGLGGGGFMLIRFADGKSTFINFREKAPAAISSDLFLDKNGSLKNASLSGGYLSGSVTNGYLVAGIPGTVLGFNTALEKYGKLSRHQVMNPAIELADKGFKLEQGDIDILNYATEDFKQQPNVDAIYLNHHNPYQTGNVLVQKDLAQTLKTIAKEGSDAFYKGIIADKIVKASQENGGVMTKEDFAHYSIEEIKPLHCQYRGYDILTSPPPGSGVTICEILNIVQGYPLHSLGYKSVPGVHYNIEAMRYAFADRNHYLGDPNFTQIPLQKLISEEHAREIRQKISPDMA